MQREVGALVLFFISRLGKAECVQFLGGCWFVYMMEGGGTGIS